VFEAYEQSLSLCLPEEKRVGVSANRPFRERRRNVILEPIPVLAYEMLKSNQLQIAKETNASHQTF
jgi:hypothetical protein